MTVLIPLSCWKSCSPQPTTKALRMFGIFSIRKSGGPPAKTYFYSLANEFSSISLSKEHTCMRVCACTHARTHTHTYTHTRTHTNTLQAYSTFNLKIKTDLGSTLNNKHWIQSCWYHDTAIYCHWVGTYTSTFNHEEWKPAMESEKKRHKSGTCLNRKQGALTKKNVAACNPDLTHTAHMYYNSLNFFSMSANDMHWYRECLE